MRASTEEEEFVLLSHNCCCCAAAVPRIFPVSAQAAAAVRPDISALPLTLSCLFAAAMKLFSAAA